MNEEMNESSAAAIPIDLTLNGLQRWHVNSGYDGESNELNRTSSKRKK